MGATQIRNRITYATMLKQAAAAVVVPGNPIGGAFTLPSGFIDYAGTGTTLYSSTGWSGYTTQSVIVSQNFQARFRPNNPFGATTYTKVTFGHNYGSPVSTTTMGAKNYTTTHGGLFDFSRNGYMRIDPGSQRFGGTMRYLYGAESLFYQYIAYHSPLFFKAYGSFACTKQGADCTKSLEQTVGEASSSGMVSRFLLAPTVFTNTATPTARFGKTMYRKIADPPVITKNYYVDLRAPWTTGMIDVYISTGQSSNYGAHPTATGYDKSLGGIDTTLTRTYTTVDYKGQGKTYYQTKKYYSTLKSVTRVVSLVTPRLLHVYQIPRIATDPIISNYAAARVQIMKVFFLPEPTGAMMLGAGVVVLLSLYRIRRR
jgi:hypothetical protein